MVGLGLLELEGTGEPGNAFLKFTGWLGTGQATVTERLDEFVRNPQLERLLAYHLGLETEDEKRLDAGMESAPGSEAGRRRCCGLRRHRAVGPRRLDRPRQHPLAG